MCIPQASAKRHRHLDQFFTIPWLHTVGTGIKFAPLLLASLLQDSQSPGKSLLYLVQEAPGPTLSSVDRALFAHRKMTLLASVLSNSLTSTSPK